MPTTASTSRALALGLLAVFLLIAAAAPASANVIYTYEGNPFTTAVNPPFTAGDRVTGFMEFADTLQANLDRANVGSLLLDWEFSAGPVTWSMGDSGITQEGFLVSTDGDGEIVGPGAAGDPRGWSVVILGEPSAAGVCNTTVSTQNLFESNMFDRGIFCNPGGTPPFSNPLVSQNPGTWTLVPEPSTATLAGFGLLALGAIGRRKQS